MAEELKYTASAVGFDKVEAAINGTTKALANTAIAANKVDSALSKSVKGTNQAAFALQNLGRFAQDAPFGIIGITNNINPLLESFQRLKVEAGSTGGALKALASSFFGAGGLGLVVSLVTSALTFFALATRGAKGGLDEISPAAKKAAEALQSVFSSTAKEVAQVEILVESFKKENLSRKEKQNIIEELQRISPAYFSNLDKEKTTVDQLTAAYDAYARSIIRSIEIKIKEGQLEKVIARRLELQEKSIKLTNIEVDENGKLRRSLNAVYDEDLKGRKQGFNNILLTQKEQKELNDLIATEKELLKGLSNLKMPQDFIKTDKLKADKRTIDDVLSDLRQQIALLNKEEFLFNIDNTKERVNAFLSAIKELAIKFDLDPNGQLIQSLFAESKFAKLGFIVQRGFLKMGVAAAKEFKSGADAAFFQDPVVVNFKMVPIETNTGILPGVHNAIQESLGALPNQADLDKAKMVGELLSMGVTTGIQDGLKVGVTALRFPELTDLVVSAKKQLEALRTAVTQELVALGDAIGNALAGAIDGKKGKEILGSFFGSLLEALGAGIRQFGIQSLAVTKIILAIKKTLGTTLGLVGSLAAIALGTLISALGAKLRVPAFAEGGITPGGTILVGERGPELITVPRGSVVTPNNQIGSVDGALSAIQVIVTGRISGKYIEIAGQRYIEERNRNT